jgi:hypothetical protein
MPASAGELGNGCPEHGPQPFVHALTTYFTLEAGVAGGPCAVWRLAA